MSAFSTPVVHNKLATCYSYLTHENLESLKTFKLREGYKFHPIALHPAADRAQLLAQKRLIISTCAGIINVSSGVHIGSAFTLVPFEEFKFRVATA
jgi:hypothetical protein